MAKISVKNLERLNTWLPEIASNLRPDTPAKPQPNGSTRFGGKGSLVVGPEAGLWYDHEAGVGGRDALSFVKHLGADDPYKWVKGFLSGHDDDGPLPGNPADDSVDDLEASRAAVEFFLAQAVGLRGTAAAVYLRNRGIKGPYPGDLKYVPEARLGEGALMAMVSNAEGAIVAVQLTYLSVNGKKSKIAPTRRLYRKTMDWSLTGAFALTLPAASKRTVLTEGVEDALSLLKTAAGTTIIACLGVQNIGKAPVDPKADVIIFRDGDEPRSRADNAVTRGVDRLVLAGNTVRVTETPLGSDANSIFLSDGPTELLHLIEEAPVAELSTEGWFEKCARMPRLNFEQDRKSIASDLGIRVSYLDEQVTLRRKDLEVTVANDETAMGLSEIEPWDEPVELGIILDETAAAITQYVHLSPIWIYTCVLWAALTHAVDMVHVLPRLAAQSPGPGCGKTVLMEAISNLVPRALTAASITAAAVFRVIKAWLPTLLIDEADQLFRGENADLLAVMNSGHRRSSAYVVRTVEVLPGQYEPTRFTTWAPIMTASIRSLPPTLQDRSIVIPLQRALPGEVQKHLRDGICPALQEAARKLARWAEDLEDLPDVKLPPAFSNRIGDNWGPLFAIAEVAGGHWPSRVLAAAKASLNAGDQGLITVLLADIREVFGGRDRMTSREIVDGLIAMEDAPYSEINRGRAITQHWFAKQLVGVILGTSSTVRTGRNTAKGYHREQFDDAWRRYISSTETPGMSSEPPETAVTTGTTSQSAEALALRDGVSVTAHPSKCHTPDDEAQMLPCDEADVTDTGCLKPQESAACDLVTVVTDTSDASEEGSGTAVDRELW